ncbi:hypothetical protein WDU94_002885 [Cyamophila willieti]
MFVQNKNQGEMMLKLAETMNINQNFILQQEMDNKIEKPNLVKPKKQDSAVNQIRQDYEKKIQDEKSEREKANGMKVIGGISDQKEVKNIKDNVNKEENVIRKEKVEEERNNTLQKDMINGEAIKKEEKEAQNEISPQPKLGQENEEKNRELEILEKLKKQEKEQAKIIKQQEKILEEVIRQNKQLEEMKQKDEKEMKENAKKSGNIKDEFEGKDNNGKLKSIEGNGLVNHLNQEKSVSNNLISEKIQELNENIKELNRDELKLSNQIDKVKDNIVIENQQIEESKNIANGLNNNLNRVSIVNQNVGDTRYYVPNSNNSINARMVDTKLNNQQLASQIVNNKISNEAVRSINSIVDEGKINTDIQGKRQKDSDLPNKVVSKVPLNINGEINNIESPPEKPQEPAISQSDGGVNDAYIEVKKDLNFKKKVLEGTLNVVKPAVPIAIMLQPNEQNMNQVSNDVKPRTSDVVKTRDILQENRREKRDVRVEPVNPVPPEYEIVNNPAPVPTILDGQMLRDIIEKTKQLERENGGDLVENELGKDGSEKSANDVMMNGNFHSKNGTNKEVNGVLNEIGTKNNATENELAKNIILENDVNKQTAPLADLDVSPSSVNEDTEKSKQYAKNLNGIGDVNAEDSNNLNEEHSRNVQQTQNTSQDKMGNTVDTSNSSNMTQKDIKINMEIIDVIVNKSKTDLSLVNNNRNETIPSDTKLKANNTNIVDDKTSDRNTGAAIVNDVNRNTIEDIKDTSNQKEVSHVNHVDNRHIGEDSNKHMGPDQNEQCERSSPDSNQDIQVPQRLSNLNPGVLILENELKSIQNHVINIAADKT